jgi:hypothetical protein
MTSKDIDNLIRWSVDTDLEKFAEEAYGITGSAYALVDRDYLRGKFRDMQTNFIRWIAGLDSRNRDRLANNITKGETNEKK